MFYKFSKSSPKSPNKVISQKLNVLQGLLTNQLDNYQAIIWLGLLTQPGSTKKTNPWCYNCLTKDSKQERIFYKTEEEKVEQNQQRGSLVPDIRKNLKNQILHELKVKARTAEGSKTILQRIRSESKLVVPGSVLPLIYKL